MQLTQKDNTVEITLTMSTLSSAKHNKKDGYRQQNVEITLVWLTMSTLSSAKHNVTIALSCTICELFDVE